MVEGGTYYLSKPLLFKSGGVTLHGKFGDRSKVVIRGEGMNSEKAQETNS